MIVKVGWKREMQWKVLIAWPSSFEALCGFYTQDKQVEDRLDYREIDGRWL
jgi:hypothetical protein